MTTKHIENTCYYVIDASTNNARFFSENSELVRLVSLLPEEKHLASSKRLDKLLDINMIGKFRPDKISINGDRQYGSHPAIYIYDKYGNTVRYCQLGENETPDLKEIVAKLKSTNSESSLFDYDWALDNNVTIHHNFRYRKTNYSPMEFSSCCIL